MICRFSVDFTRTQDVGDVAEMKHLMPARVFTAILKAFAFIILIGVSALVLIPPSTRSIVHLLGRKAPATLIPLFLDLVAHLMLLIIVVVLTIVLSGMRRGGIARNGLPFDQRSGRLAMAGLVAGGVGMAAVVGIIAPLGGYTILGWRYGVDAGCMVAAICVVTYLLVGASEELWLRGYPLGALTSAIGFWPAAITLSLIFGMLHGLNSGENLGSELLIALAGLAACQLRRVTGSLWFGIGAHAAFDYGQGVILSGPDGGEDMLAEHLLMVRIHGPDWMTGGRAGFESSLAGAAVALLMVVLPSLWFHWQKKARWDVRAVQTSAATK